MSTQLNLSIPDDLNKEVQAYADSLGISKADAVRILLRQALAAKGQLAVS